MQTAETSNNSNTRYIQYHLCDISVNKHRKSKLINFQREFKFCFIIGKL